MRTSTLLLFVALSSWTFSCVGGEGLDPDCVEGRCDGPIGWIEENGRCLEFNKECAGELTCRPLDPSENDLACLPPSEDGWCDDDDDCFGEHVCLGNSLFSAGTCSDRQQQSDRCFDLDLECANGLVCRPLDRHDIDSFCMPPGEANDFCDNDSDCQAGLCVESIFGGHVCKEL